MDILIVLLRFVLTFVFSLLFGIDRQKSHKPIGFGTFIFVSIGSCALAITAINLAPEAPLPLLGAIVSGIGFLGAGALIKTTDKIFGFTSAASIWLFAIFGLVIGVGEYLVAGLIYVLVWIVILYDRRLEHKGIGSYQRKIVIVTNRFVSEHEIENEIAVGSIKHKKILVELDKKNNRLSLTYLIEGHKEDINRIPKRLYERDWFDSFKGE